MRLVIILCMVVTSPMLCAQNLYDTTPAPVHMPLRFRPAEEGVTKSPFSYKSQKKLIVKGNVTFTTYSLQLSQIEQQISDAESRECNAIPKRDTSVLKTIWARDFTLDAPLNEVVASGNPLPYYAPFFRMVETFTTINNNLVYTSGYETFKEISPGLQVSKPVTRKFFHTWIRKYGAWKLSRKSYQ